MRKEYLFGHPNKSWIVYSLAIVNPLLFGTSATNYPNSRDALHKTTKQFVEWCVQQSVSDVYMGNPEGVQRKTRKKKKANRKQAGRLSNWSFGKVKKYLKYKLAQKGIELHEADEAYTSQTCPVCQKRRKVSSRNYRCSCGYQEHRDIHGARNILSKSLYGKITDMDVPTKQTYLRIA